MQAEIFGMDGVVVAVIAAAVIFGANKIPQMARSIGRAQGEFKKGLSQGAVEDESDTPSTSTEPKGS